MVATVYHRSEVDWAGQVVVLCVLQVFTFEDTMEICDDDQQVTNNQRCCNLQLSGNSLKISIELPHENNMSDADQRSYHAAREY